MTRYEHGFIRKCAEAGIDRASADRMLKQALVHLPRGLHWMHHFLPFDTDVDVRRRERQIDRDTATMTGRPEMRYWNSQHPYDVGLASLGVNRGATGFEGMTFDDFGRPRQLDAATSNAIHRVGQSLLDQEPRLVASSKNGYGYSPIHLMLGFQGDAGKYSHPKLLESVLNEAAQAKAIGGSGDPVASSSGGKDVSSGG